MPLLSGRPVDQIPIDSYIENWNYIPKKFIFHKVNTEEELYLGAEIEIDKGGESEVNAKFVMEFMNCLAENVYCKHDGSLVNGFEIVTHPSTFEYYKQLQYDKLFEWLIEKGYRAHDTTTCGLHIHFNRNYFGENKLEQDLCISKLLYLFEKYWKKVEKIARRSSCNFARRFYLDDNDTPLDLYAKSRESDKYGAINLKHKDTVEIRIFKGTLNYETFICTLEFVNKMVHIAKETDIYNIQSITWNNILEHFSEDLISYIKNRTKQSESKEHDNCREITEADDLKEQIKTLICKIRHVQHVREKRELKKELSALKRKLKQAIREENQINRARILATNMARYAASLR